MALPNAPFGFRVCRHLTGGDPNRTVEYPIASAYATALGQGDAMKLLNDGTISAASAGDRVIGFFQGVSYTAADGSQQFTNYWPASTVGTNIKASITGDPMVSLTVMCAATAANLVQTIVGNCADLVTGTPSAFTGNSTAYLSATASNAIATFRILKILDYPGNTGQYALVEVQVIEHELLYHGQGTVGV